MNFGECDVCGEEALVKLNGKPLCVECLEWQVLKIGKTVIKLTEGIKNESQNTNKPN